MDMTGQQRIPASRDTVWKALNDVEVLKACIPGCQELIKISDTEMTAMAVIKVGPVTAKFQGAVTLSEIDPPNGYRITGEGQGGVAGFAKGGAAIRLEQDGDGTILYYDVSAQVGGKLSQLGGRLIDATAKQMSNLFFKRFAEEIETRYGDQPATTGSSAAATAPAAKTANAASRQEPRRDTPPSHKANPSFFSSIKSAGLIALIAAIGACWYLLGGHLPAPQPMNDIHLSSDFTGGVMLLLVAAVGYLFGRQKGSAVQFDQDAIERLARALTQQRG